MSGPDILLTVVIGVTALLAALVALRADVTRARGGKILAFGALCVLPVLSLASGYSTHMERAQTTEFCLSCHVMSDHGRTLLYDDASYVPASHFQNNRVPRDRACYTCHTDYTMFGGVTSKVRGLRHMYVHYIGTEPAPQDIALYQPYNNRECLQCHNGARQFEAQPAHNRTPEALTSIKNNTLGCTSSRCHDIVHEVEALPDETFWNGVTLP
jgi:cytochrome c-type protein NapC